MTFPETSSAPLRWKKAGATSATTNIDFNVRPVQHVEEVEHTTIVEREVHRTAFNLELASPKNGTAQQVPFRERTTTTTRVRTVAGPGRSVLSGRNPSATGNATPFNDPFGDNNVQATQSVLGNPRSNADEEAVLLQPGNGGDFQPDSSQPELLEPDAQPLTPPQPGADPDDRPPMPPTSLRQIPQAESELGPSESLDPTRDLPGDRSAQPSRVPGRRGCGLYNDRDCCEDETECLKSLDRVKTDTLRMFGKDRLDITPRYKPDADTPEEIEAAEARKAQQLALSGSRRWKNKDGRIVAEGQLLNLMEGKAVIETEGGRQVEVKLRQLGDDDLCFIAAWYNLPTECTLGNDPYFGRQCVASTFTWKASDLCHKPLYFEEVQLERYGHTAGPIAQPVISGAHFFANIALLPYKMGINPPGECQYALGYYRPGSCAPWVIPPFPLSARGAATATGFYTAGVLDRKSVV